MDKIFISQLRLRTIIGIHENERKIPQDILVSVTVYTDTGSAAHLDDVTRSVDYASLSKNICALVKKARRYTVEALGEDIADLCLATPGVHSVIVRVEKPGALKEAASVGVEITRRNP